MSPPTACSGTVTCNGDGYFQPAHKAALQAWVKAACSGDTSTDYGDVGGFDTSLITDMSHLFYNKNTCDTQLTGIGLWDMSSVTTFEYVPPPTPPTHHHPRNRLLALGVAALLYPLVQRLGVLSWADWAVVGPGREWRRSW